MSVQELEALAKYKAVRDKRHKARRKHFLASVFVGLNLVLLSMGVFWVLAR